MLILLLPACSLVFGPRPALVEAHEALKSGDLATFETRVDLDTVAAQATEGCVRVTLLEDWGELSQRKSPLRDLALSAGRGLLGGLVEASAEDLARQARAEFGQKSIEELCPAIQPGPPSQLRLETQGDRATASLPITAWGASTWLQADMREGEGGWRVVGLDFDPAIADIKAHLEAQASGAGASQP
jgi:hypothetical protein